MSNYCKQIRTKAYIGLKSGNGLPGYTYDPVNDTFTDDITGNVFDSSNVHKPEQIKTVNITENGEINILPDTGKTLAKVVANVSVSGGGSTTHKVTIKTYDSAASEWRVNGEAYLPGLTQDSEIKLGYSHENGSIVTTVAEATGDFAGLTAAGVVTFGIVSEFRSSGIISGNDGYGVHTAISEITTIPALDPVNLQVTEVDVTVGSTTYKVPCYSDSVYNITVEAVQP